MKNRIAVLFLVIALLVTQAAQCQGAKEVLTTDPIQKYHGLIEAYQNARMQTVNGKNCVVAAYNSINIQVGLGMAAMQAEVARTDAYRKALTEYGAKANPAITGAQKNFEKGLGAYTDKSGNPIPVDKLDLAALAQQNALPSQLVGEINVAITQFTEAPLPPSNFGPIENAQRESAEKMNQVVACAMTSNEAIRSYNVIPGDVVGRLAEYLGVKELPQELPYFELQGSEAPPVVPTFSIPGGG